MEPINRPFIHISFIDDALRQCPLFFVDPVEVITADKIDDVIPALRRVEEATRQGYYAVGYISYEASPAFEPAAVVSPCKSLLPLVWYGIYKSPEPSASVQERGHYRVSRWIPNIERDEYKAHIERIHHEIEMGVTYQVNHTMRLQAHFTGDAYAYFLDLIQAQRAPYAAFIDTGRHQILSASPELFYSKTKDHIRTKPMKGTWTRGLTLEDDVKHQEALRTSVKDRAENLMIVDLLRNDIGRIAKTGTVQVPELFTIEKYHTVFQMTSTVTADIKEHTGLVDAMTALFPCGSITGAPKLSTMKLTAELETDPRGVYCGAIGIEYPDGTSKYNVAIRTVVVDSESHTAEYGVGGGITWDSTELGEYMETVQKSKVLTTRIPNFELLETMKLADGNYTLLERHLLRLKSSAEYFSIAVDEDLVRRRLQETADEHSTGTYRVRLLVGNSSDVTLQATRMEPSLTNDNSLAVVFAEDSIDSSNPFIYHKTTHRTMYEERMVDTVFDVLLWNEKSEITEFTKGNIVIEDAEVLYTPPIACGLLNGTLRAELVAEGRVKERILTKADVQNATQMWFINSVRGWIPVHLSNS